jgi:hypothetical protein
MKQTARHGILRASSHHLSCSRHNVPAVQVIVKTENAELLGLLADVWKPVRIMSL